METQTIMKMPKRMVRIMLEFCVLEELIKLQNWVNHRPRLRKSKEELFSAFDKKTESFVDAHTTIGDYRKTYSLLLSMKRLSTGLSWPQNYGLLWRVERVREILRRLICYAQGKPVKTRNPPTLKDIQRRCG